MKGNKMENLVIKNINDSEEDLNKLRASVTTKENDLLFEYPTIYFHISSAKNFKQYDIYIGETIDIIKRTKEHIMSSFKINTWQNKHYDRNEKKLYIIGHDYFNKSLTLDLEDKFIKYMLSSPSINRLWNCRSNGQNKYYTKTEKNRIFNEIWNNLNAINPKIFPIRDIIENSAIYKTSGQDRLTSSQEEIQDIIINKVFNSINSKEHELVFIEGSAGTGKTVLTNSVFHKLYEKYNEITNDLHDFKCCLMVNHDQQFLVYDEIARRTGLSDKYGEVIFKPTRFINEFSPDNPIDVAFVDEAHLLLTQGKQSYRGENQLKDIIERAKITIVMFDKNQILTTEQIIESDYIRKKAIEKGNYLELQEQLRMNVDEEVYKWINDFTKYQIISNIPNNTSNYEIKIFDNPFDLELAINKKNFVTEESLSEEAIEKKILDGETNLSRIVATYDWNYNQNPKSRINNELWSVSIQNWKKPWNYELGDKYKNHGKIKKIPWAENPYTIKEIGSTFSIQGFDLNYVGVILGPSVKYENGKIVFKPENSKNQKATRNRTLKDGSKKKFGDILIKNEVNVLMTRGVKGLYIYGCDPELRKVLLKASEGSL